MYRYQNCKDRQFHRHFFISAISWFGGLVVSTTTATGNGLSSWTDGSTDLSYANWAGTTGTFAASTYTQIEATGGFWTVLADAPSSAAGYICQAPAA